MYLVIMLQNVMFLYQEVKTHKKNNKEETKH